MKYYYGVTLWLWVVIILCNHNKCSGCLEKERIGLLELKKEFLEISRKLKLDDYYYDHLSTWEDNTGSDCCIWDRVQCNNSTNRQVIQLSLRSIVQLYVEDRIDLNASLFLPFEELQHLDLTNNQITNLEGLERLSKLEELHFLDLGWNRFNNNILPSLNALASLKTLNLGSNNICNSSLIQGFDVFSNLQMLEELVLEDNKCNNNILPFLGVLKSLKTLDLSDNYLEGSLSEFSKAFTNMSNLEVLDLEDNGLNSFLQSHDWKNTSKLKVLSLGYNNFSWGIPQSILTLNSLQALSMPQTNLSGPISSGLCELQNLRDLDLSANKFEGILPPCFNNLTSLRVVDFSDNQLHIPSSLISDLKSLDILLLSGNRINGSLALTPPLLSNQLKYLDMSNCNLNLSTIDLFKFLHNQYDLRYLRLLDNSLHGSFPNWLVQNNTKLQFFDLRNNSLTGNIQLSVVNSSLYKFDVSNNHIQGKLQTDIGVVLSNIITLNLSKNNIEGTLPTSLDNVNFMNLDFSSNNLSGKIPESWGLQSINTLILSNNRLHSRISPNLLTNVSILRLSNNQFTGNLPSHIPSHIDERFEPCGLINLDLSQNHISGRIPSWLGQSCIDLGSLILRNNSFYGPIPPEFF